MDMQQLLALQSKRGASVATVGGKAVKTLDKVVQECREYLENFNIELRTMDRASKQEAIRGYIQRFVLEKKPLVSDMIDENGQSDLLEITNVLTDNITDYGILTKAINDPAINEIRVNGRYVWIERGGKSYPLMDDRTGMVQFSTLEEQNIVMRKLIGETRLTPKDAYVSTSTYEGFRIAAVHGSTLSPDPRAPKEPKFHAFVLRKFPEIKININGIVKYGTMSDNMARFAMLMAPAQMTFSTVGPTASGKTTTNQAILSTNPHDNRLIIVQNPSEMDLRQKDSSGRIINDVLHMEAFDIENPTPTSPTQSNAMSQIMRLSPVIAGFGETRKPAEFIGGQELSLAGHAYNSSYHSDTIKRAIKRAQQAYMQGGTGEPASLVLSNICDSYNIMIVQHIMSDGTRRVLELGEVLGVDPNNENEPLINMLYEFKFTGEPIYKDGKLYKIIGEHKRVGKLSEKTIAKLKKAGIPECKYDFLMKDLDEDFTETYTGENLLEYNNDKVVNA